MLTPVWSDMYVASVYRVIGVLTRKFVVDPAYRNQGIGRENSHVLLRVT